MTPPGHLFCISKLISSFVWRDGVQDLDATAQTASMEVSAVLRGQCFSLIKNRPIVRRSGAYFARKINLTPTEPMAQRTTLSP